MVEFLMPVVANEANCLSLVAYGVAALAGGEALYLLGAELGFKMMSGLKGGGDEALRRQIDFIKSIFPSRKK